MNISTFGLGYVGAVTAACLAELGHHVIGVEVNRVKVDMINAAQAPIVEPQLQELIAAAVREGRLHATGDAEAAVLDSNVSLICVGTPAGEDGAVSLDAVESVIAQIGHALRAKRDPHAVVVRSTVPPGTTQERLAPALEATSGRHLGEGLELYCNPEFLREGSAIRDFYNPPFTIVGSRTETCTNLIEQVYRGIPAPLHRTSCGLAESVKYICNAFHALKITFANEIGSLLKAKGLDGRQAMQLFCQDHQLNLSSAYLRPGFAFGGSCLPKDTRALVHLARTQNVRLPLLEQILASNEGHIERALRLIMRNGRRSVALFGLAFKAGTDDLRDSPLVALAERLIGKGYPIRIFDKDIELSRLTGSNRDFIEQEIPHLERLLATSPEVALDGAEIIVVGHAGPSEVAAIVGAHAGRPIIDLQGIETLRVAGRDAYIGICW